jgi:hypothetical protein
VYNCATCVVCSSHNESTKSYGRSVPTAPAKTQTSDTFRRKGTPRNIDWTLVWCGECVTTLACTLAWWYLEDGYNNVESLIPGHSRLNSDSNLVVVVVAAVMMVGFFLVVVRLARIIVLLGRRRHGSCCDEVEYILLH